MQNRGRPQTFPAPPSEIKHAQARRRPTGIHVVFPRHSTPHGRISYDSPSEIKCVQARRRPQRILCVCARPSTPHDRISYDSPSEIKCVQARRRPQRILCVCARPSTPHDRISYDSPSEIKCVQARRRPQRILCVCARPSTPHERILAARKRFSRSDQPHRAVSMGIICFLRLMTLGRKSALSLGSVEKARRMVSSLPI